jgi:hypothetical protein
LRRGAVRVLALLLLLLAVLCQVAVRFETGPLPLPEEPTSEWVRTVRGWEELDTLRGDPLPPLTLHPSIVAAGLLCGSMLALLVFERGK